MNEQKKRFRDYGFSPGFLNPGPLNSIADVGNVTVGHVTKIEGDDVRTGVTIIDPGAENLFRTKLPAAIAVGNGYGKLAGITQVEELGTMETHIGLTNTLAVGPVIRGIVDHIIQQTPDINPTESINAIVGETNDGLVNNLHADTITKQDVHKAIAAGTKQFAAGCVGAGTGTRAFSWKGGIGTSSRSVTVDGKTYTIGALVQTNYGGALTIMGTPIGKLLEKTDFDKHLPTGDGSCMIILATDAPVDARQLKRMAYRSFIALGRTGSVLANGSGDYAIAFSTNRAGLPRTPEACLEEKDLTPLFLASVEATEESVYDALFLATTTEGRGKTLEALPIDEVVQLLKSHL